MIRAFEITYFLVLTTAMYLAWRALLSHTPLWYEGFAAGFVFAAVSYRFTKIT